MAPPNSEQGLWSVEGLPVRIDYSPAVLREIAAAAVEGLYRFRHGGVEVGGVLFGAATGEGVSIVASRPLNCEHAFGPRFALSDRDRANMKQLLDQPHRDPELAGLVPVGWYHSHTRSEIALSPRDMEIYDRFLPQPWQVAMVLRPESYGLARAAFFVRERGGTAQCEEFTLRPERSRVEPPPEAAREAAPPPGHSEPAHPRTEERAARPAAAYEPEPPPLPSFMDVQPARSRRWIWLVAAIVVALAGGAGVEAYYRYTAPQQSLALFVADVGGQLLIEWDRTARPIQDAEKATIEVLDGGERRDIPIDGNSLREGSISYTRSSEIVDIRLRVDTRGSRPAQEFIRFVGQPVRRPPTAAEADVMRERDTLKAENERLRGEIQKRDARARRPRPQAPKPVVP